MTTAEQNAKVRELLAKGDGKYRHLYELQLQLQ